MQKTLIVESTKDGKKVQKAYGYLNPEATDAQLEGFAQMTNALTTNEYVGAGVVTRRAVDEPDSGGGAAVPADFAQIVIDNVGSQFTPAVTTPADFVENAPFNVQYFDNNIKHILDGGQNYEIEPTTDCVLLNGTCTVTPVTVNSATAGGSIWYLKRSDTEQQDSLNYGYGNSWYLEQKKNSRWVDFSYIKLTETSCYSIAKNQHYISGSDIWYDRNEIIKPFALLDDGSVYMTKSDQQVNYEQVIIDFSYDSVSGSSKHLTSPFLRSPFSPNDFMYTTHKYNPSDTESFHSYQACLVACYEESNTFPTTTRRMEQVATTRTPKTQEFGLLKAYSPVISFDGESVTLAKGETPRNLPFAKEHTVTYNSSTGALNKEYIYIYPWHYSKDSGGQPKVDFFTPYNKNSSGQETVKPWIEDDNNIILGVYPTKNYSDCYAVTYKEGTYSKDSWLDDAFTVWRLERDTPAVVQTDKSITDIADRVI